MRKILGYAAVEWSKIVESDETPVELCLRRKIPVYIKIDTSSQLVYRYYHSSISPDQKIAFEGLYDDLAYLRLEESILEEIAVFGEASVSSFECGGLSSPKNLIVEKVEFDRVELIDRNRWEEAKRHFELNMKEWEMRREWVELLRNAEETPSSEPAEGRFEGASRLTIQDIPEIPHSLMTKLRDIRQEKVVVTIKIDESDLHFEIADIESMMQDALKKRGRAHCPYPFTHEKEMPGLYWMYQAAYVHNKLGSLTTKKSSVERLQDVKAWLLENDKNAYPSRSIRNAAKFVPLHHDRKRGKLRKEFVPDVYDERKSPDFISKGLSCILSIADWWERYYQGDKEDRLMLAIKLDASGFEGLELGDLVHLISGKPLSAEDVLAFEAHLTEKGQDHKPFDFVDKEKRPKRARTKQ
ncbi:hypothetical protein ACFFJT_13025 [Dyella flava]|uniref:Uncharacterized protein n=1 Tax=Dyella flava TaxID=1920170 RepID=A0ABS2K033_9GAMM|nr:hypothetical protein [Dyella flava]MBM7124415.1 hypothetical protein [Dyella flava]GLQ52504.1 hypothetical protein GCM10010872_39530 [Dyella flava]